MASVRLSFRWIFLSLVMAATLVSGLEPASGGISEPRQALIICLRLSDAGMGAEGESFALYDVEDAVESAVSNIGKLDGHQIGGGYFKIFVYGASAKAMFDAARPALGGPLVKPGSYALLKFGSDKIPDEQIGLPIASRANSNGS